VGNEVERQPSKAKIYQKCKQYFPYLDRLVFVIPERHKKIISDIKIKNVEFEFIDIPIKKMVLVSDSTHKKLQLEAIDRGISITRVAEEKLSRINF